MNTELSRRSADTVTEADRAVQCNRNMVANSLSNRRFSNSEIITSAHFKNKDAIAQQGACSCKSQWSSKELTKFQHKKAMNFQSSWLKVRQNFSAGAHKNFQLDLKQSAVLKVWFLFIDKSFKVVRSNQFAPSCWHAIIFLTVSPSSRPRAVWLSLSLVIARLPSNL